MEAKYEALKKQSSKAYIAEGKCWDDTDSEDEDSEICNYSLMAHSRDDEESLSGQGTRKEKKVVWIVDSGCSAHMTGDKALLSHFEERAGPLVTLGDDSIGTTMGMASWKL